jgi:hypothetical protein
MQIKWIAGVLFAGVLGTAAVGCAVDSQGADEDTQSSVSEESSQAYTSGVGAKLGGNYVSADTLHYPTLSLDAKAQTYVWDSGIRCVRAPCPSGDSGRWAAYRAVPSQNIYVNLVSTTRKSRWFKVDFDGNREIKGLVGVWGTPEKFVPARVADPCATVRCAVGTHCEAVGNQASCVPDAVAGCEAMLCIEGSYCVEDSRGQGSCIQYPTCKTTKCAGGQYCADRPIVCITSPCAPTAPSCESCPRSGTFFNCMPGPGTRALECAAHESITANCPGVTFAF